MSNITVPHWEKKVLGYAYWEVVCRKGQAPPSSLSNTCLMQPAALWIIAPVKYTHLEIDLNLQKGIRTGQRVPLYQSPGLAYHCPLPYLSCHLNAHILSVHFSLNNSKVIQCYYFKYFTVHFQLFSLCLCIVLSSPYNMNLQWSLLLKECNRNVYGYWLLTLFIT